MHRSNKDLFDHLVGAGEHGRRHLDAERLCGGQVDPKLKMCRLLNRKVAGFLPHDTNAVLAGRVIRLFPNGTIRDEHSVMDSRRKGVNGGASNIRGGLKELLSMVMRKPTV